MKKVLLIVLLAFLILLPAFSDQTIYAPLVQYMLGHVDSAVEFGIEILEEVLPFDLDGRDVAYNPTPDSTISGLQIGSYSLVSNTRYFDLYITHTPLVLITTPIAGETCTLETIDYRLYMVMNYGTSLFNHCLSSGSIQISGDNYSIWDVDDSMLIVREGLFVSLDDGNGTTATSVGNLKAGTYSSTITFELWGR